MKAPTQDLSKFTYQNLLQFAQDSQSNNEYQQRVIDSFSDVLTKREHFAIELMAAARSNAIMFERVDTCSLYLAIGAIQDADALLKELDK